MGTQNLHRVAMFGFAAGTIAGFVGSGMYQRVTGGVNVEYQEKGIPAPNLARAQEIFKYGRPERAPLLSYYENHVLGYDYGLKIPLWVAEHITQDTISGKAHRKHSKFKPDPEVPSRFSADNKDYWNSGWSRGHMAPAGNNKHSQEAMNQSFYLSNVLPQNIDNNAGFWNRFEMYCRDLTKKYRDVRVISGPVMLPQQEEDGKFYVKYQVIGDSQVAVPTHLYKVVVAENSDEDRSMGAFIVPNKPIGSKHELKEYEVPLEYLEERTGQVMLNKLKDKQTKNLCQSEGCKLMDYAEFELYFIGRKLESAKTLARLDKVWGEIAAKNLKPNDYISSLYYAKHRELERKAAVQPEE